MTIRKHLEGDRFGKLVIIGYLGQIKGRSKYLCKCDCGKITEVWGTNFRGNTQSCGCMIGKNSKGADIKLKPGYIFPDSELIERISYKKFKCKCVCGKEFILTSNRLYKKITHCGCLGGFYTTKQKGKRNPIHFTIYRLYKYNANLRKKEFNIDIESFLKLITANCHYCNSEPQSHIVYSGPYRDNYKYNGLDRVDNNIGYILNNCVTCCKFCNRAKKDENLVSFLEWLDRLKCKSVP